MIYIKNRKDFLNEDVNLANSIVKKKMEDFEKLKNLLSKNIGYLGKFTEYLFHEHIPYNELVNLYNDLLSLKSLSKSIDISKLSYEKCLDKIVALRNDIKVNSVISQFTSDQKKMAREMVSDKKFYNSLLTLSSSENLEKLTKKISRYKTPESLKSAVLILSKNPKNERQEVKEVVSTLKSKIVFENENILIVKVDNYEDIKILGSDTSWCIVASKSTFERYLIDSRSQYILYNYKLDQIDPFFKIGFTVSAKSVILYAHNTLDHSCVSKLKTFLSENSVVISSLNNNNNNNKISVINSCNQIKSSTLNDSIYDFCMRYDLKDITEIVYKIMTISKSDTFRKKALDYIFHRYFNEKKYILSSFFDIYDDKKSVYHFLGGGKKSIYKYLDYSILKRIIDKFSLSLEPDIIPIALNIWTDEDILIGLKNEDINSLETKYNNKYWSSDDGKKTSLMIVERFEKLLKSKGAYEDFINGIENTEYNQVGLYIMYISFFHKLDNYYTKNYKVINKGLDTNNIRVKSVIKAEIDPSKIYTLVSANGKMFIDFSLVTKVDMKKDSYIMIYGTNLSLEIKLVKEFLDHMKGYCCNFSITLNKVFTIRESPNIKDEYSSKFTDLIINAKREDFWKRRNKETILLSEDGKVKIKVL